MSSSHAFADLEAYSLPEGVEGIFPLGMSNNDREIARKIAFCINTDSAHFVPKLIEAIGRNDMVGRILIGFYKQEIAGGPVLNVFEEVRNMKPFFNQRDRNFFFWDRKKSAVYLTISPDDEKPECLNASLTFWRQGKMLQQSTQTQCK
jgi:hypothetical protein